MPLARLGFELPRRKMVQVAIGADRQEAPRMPGERQVALEHLQELVGKALPGTVMDMIAARVRPAGRALLQQEQGVRGVAELL